MESFTIVLNLLDIPTSITKDLIALYQHCINDENETCRMECNLNTESRDNLINCLIKLPYETSIILNKLQIAYKTKHCQSFIDIISTVIINHLENFLNDSQNEIDNNTIYTLISLLEYCETDKLQEIFKLLYELTEKGKLNKDLIYMSLIPQDNMNILNKYLLYEKENFNNCTISDSKSLFKYCLYKKQHWIFHIIENKLDYKQLNKNILQKLLLLKLNYITNLDPTDFPQIANIITKLPKNITKDKFFQFYINEISWNLELYRFIYKITPEKIQNFKLLSFKSCLDVLSSFVDIQDIDKYDKLNTILIQNEKYLSEMKSIRKNNLNLSSISELDLYNGFCLITLIEQFILENKNPKFPTDKNQELLKKITNQILSSTNLEFQFEIFENVFTMIFLQNKHLNNEEDDDNFICEQKEVLFIAMFLKATLKDLKRRHFSGVTDKQNKFYLRLSCLINYVKDTIWRLELLKTQNLIRNDNKIVNLLLSSPNTLIYLCLENDNFEKAHEVIQMYNMQDSYIAQEIDYIEKIQYLKLNTNHSNEIINFCTANDEYYNAEDDNDIFRNLIDITFTYDTNYDKSKEFFEAVVKYNDLEHYENDYLKFCYNIYQVFKAIGPKENLSVPQILNNSKYPLEIEQLNKKQNYYNDIQELYNNFLKLLPNDEPGTFNKNHNCQDIFINLSEISHFEINYLKKLYNYLKLLSTILFIKEDNSNTIMESKNSSIFNLLNKNTADIVGKLLFQHNLQPKDLEKIFVKLNLDIVYKIAWNCLPEINLTISNINYKNLPDDSTNFEDVINNLKASYSKEIALKDKLTIKPDVFLLSYIRNRNWLLAYLLNKIYSIEEIKTDPNSDRIKYFNNFLNLKSIQNLKLLFDNNSAIACLHNNETIITKLLQYLDENYDKTNYEISKSIYEMLNSIPESILLTNNTLIRLKDLTIYNLLNISTDYMKIVQKIENNELRLKCILENLKNWDGEFCIYILNCELSRWDINEDSKNIINKKFYEIELYENIKNVFELNSWHEIYKKSADEPKEIFLLLLTSKQITLLLKWIEINKPKSQKLLHLITINYFLLLLEDQTDLSQIKTLLDLLQFDHKVQICKNLLKQIKKLEYNEFITSYLINILPELESEYKNIQISLKIFSCFNQNEHEFMFCLITKPSLIIEQLIMNVRLEKLNYILEKIKPILREAEENNIEIDVSIEGIDCLLRTYAKKALDFRGIQPSAGLKNLELKLMQSLDTVSVDSDRKIFVIPEKVPDKSNWIQNEQALECMCCHEVTFSMFNRRHHCRRCGRVICGNCSHKRMEIPEYGSIPVRVCNDCYKYSQTEDPNMLLNKSEQSSNKSGSLTCWILSDDEKHNVFARDEFSYEYAPSVSLCLSILKAHSNNVTYPKFLLEQCEILLPYLQDVESEIDFSYVIQMIKSLVTVAKITSLHNSYKTELSKCNEILLHIDLLSLLVEKDCLELLRSTTKVFGNFESGVLRRLRDKLIEQEQWSLALEISTKVGLEKTGIFAAWGKSCLKAGALQTAREKFQYCLEKTLIYETDLSTSISMSYDHDDAKKIQHKSVTLSTVSETRPSKTPPLINEIISVLESNDQIVDKSVFRTFENVSLNSSTLSLNTNSGFSFEPAVSILNKIKNLKNIIGVNNSTNNRSRKNSKISVDRFSNSLNLSNNAKKRFDPCFYNECMYYLMKYASHSTILQFYLRHDEFDEALNYILENRLQNDYFIEVYVKCLEDGKVEILQEQMQIIDCSLNCWEIYLKSICRHLETNSMFNVLYQLQLFMCDYVRAAMTCIKFYKENTNNFKELLDHEEYLFKAQNHLKQELEQEQWVKVTPVRKASTASSSSSHSKSSIQTSLIMKIDPRNIDKYINTIWRQIEITKFLAECEIDNRPTLDILKEIYSFNDDSQTKQSKVPTLFDSQVDKMKLAVMALVCGKNVEQGFGLAFRIIQDHNLKYLKVYCLAGKYLARILRDTAVIDLINCIKSSGLNVDTVYETCDEVLMTAVCSLLKASGTGTQLENLIKLITDPGVKVDAYLESRQLKRAYLLAIKYNRITDIKKILREAERYNQPQIKAICIKRLNQTKLK